MQTLIPKKPQTGLFWQLKFLQTRPGLYWRPPTCLPQSQPSVRFTALLLGWALTQATLALFFLLKLTMRNKDDHSGRTHVRPPPT
jgi:hypothetical protein